MALSKQDTTHAQPTAAESTAAYSASIQQLNEAFKRVLTKTSDVPQSLAKWQAQLQSFIEQGDYDEAELASSLQEWARVLEVNKHLLTEHQETLKDKLRTGEPSPAKECAVKRYQP